MSQDSIQISETPPLPGLQLVQQVNGALETVASDFAGATDPAAKAGPYMTWADTANSVVKRRNAANTQWVVVGSLFAPAAPSTPANSIPTTDQGTIAVPGYGLMEYDSSIYGRYISVQPAHGQCQLLLSSSTLLTLAPYHGQRLMVNGRAEKVASPTLSNAGLTNNTTYHLYSYMNSGAMTIEPSVTAPVVGSDGVKIKTGDPSRTYVGTIRYGAGVFNDNLVARGVASHFNRRLRPISTNFSGASTTSATFITLGGVTISTLQFADESLEVSFGGLGSVNSAGQNLLQFVAVDGVAATTQQTLTESASLNGINVAIPPGFVDATGSDQFRAVTLQAAVSAGWTAAWTGKLQARTNL